MSQDTENPYAPPTSNPIPEMTDAPTYQLATLGERFAGALIDGLISIPVTVLLFTMLYFMGAFASLDQVGEIGFAYNILFTIASLALFALIHGAYLKSNGQTIGKKVMKTKIVRMNHSKPDMIELVGKRYGFMYLVSLIPGVGSLISLVNILFIFRADRRCLHDLIAGTQVVKA